MKHWILLVGLMTAIPFAHGQNKKELNTIIDRLKSDSSALQLQIEKEAQTNSKLAQEISECQKESLKLKNKNNKLLQKTEAFNRISKGYDEQINQLSDSISRLIRALDSSEKFDHVIRFTNNFYRSLELTEEENQRHYENGGVIFNLDNFNSMISKNAEYSKKRVESLSDPSYHDRYYVELLEIEEIQFSNNLVIVKSKVMYAGDELGSFYNREKLTLKENRGLLKLAKWIDLGLYKSEVADYEGLEDFGESDFYRWIGSFNKK